MNDEYLRQLWDEAGQLDLGPDTGHIVLLLTQLELSIASVDIEQVRRYFHAGVYDNTELAYAEREYCGFGARVHLAQLNQER